MAFLLSIRKGGDEVKHAIWTSVRMIGFFCGIYILLLALATRVFAETSTINLGTRILTFEITAIFLIGYFICKLRNISGTQFILYCQSLILSVLLCTLFLLSGPALVERSLTVYLMEKISDGNGQVNQVDLTNMAREQWWEGKNQVEFRLNEEIEGGYIVRNPDETFSVGILGHFVVNFARLTKRIFALN